MKEHFGIVRQRNEQEISMTEMLAKKEIAANLQPTNYFLVAVPALLKQ
jgi:hypothetical protein